jgi:hypothetical protein
MISVGSWARSLCGALSCALIVGVVSSAHAEPRATDKATARSLFDEGKRLAAAGKYDEACHKFEASQQLDIGAGVSFHLADCYEHVGKTASAWSLYLEVAAAMKTANQPEREEAARTKANALEPKLSRLTVVVPDSVAAWSGIKIERDELVLTHEMWNTALPVDPGKHEVRASAPSKKTWTGSVQVGAEGAQARLEVPALEPAPETEARVAPKPGPATSMWRGQRLTGMVVGGAGVVLLGAGTILGFSAKSRYDESSSHCSGDFCNQQGLDLRSEGISKANVATAVGAVGVAAIAAGVVIFLTAPKPKTEEKPSASAFRAQVGLGPGSLTIAGAW